MNLIYAQVVEVYAEEGERMGKVSVWGVCRAVPLQLVPEALPGDTVLICDGVAIGKVNGGYSERYMAGEQMGMAQAASLADPGSVPLSDRLVTPGVTSGTLAGADARATLKGAIDVSGSSR